MQNSFEVYKQLCDKIEKTLDGLAVVHRVAKNEAQFKLLDRWDSLVIHAANPAIKRALLDSFPSKIISNRGEFLGIHAIGFDCLSPGNLTMNDIDRSHDKLAARLYQTIKKLLTLDNPDIKKTGKQFQILPQDLIKILGEKADTWYDETEHHAPLEQRNDAILELSELSSALNHYGLCSYIEALQQDEQENQENNIRPQ